jgi:cysteine desulfurase/selenocysteine lyase
MSIEQFKNHFYSGENFVHLNNSGQAPIPAVNRDLAQKWLNRLYSEGAFCAMEGWDETDRSREKLAQFIGAETKEVSFFQTTASALSQVAFGIPLSAGDEILTWDQEYPSNFYPWRIAAERNRAQLVQLKSENWQTPAKKILERVSDKTKAVAISWVQYQTGAVTDLKELSQALRGRNIWLVADVIQGVGVRPFNFHDSGFDVICGGSHKFLCSNYGAAFMAIRKERIKELAPLEFGAMTYGNPDTEKSFLNQPKAEALRYEPGSKAMVEIIALGATLDLFTQFGIEAISREACRLADRLRFGLKEQNFDVLSPEGPIVTFAPKSSLDLERLSQKLTDANISFARRGPGFRLSTHAFNRDSDIDRALKCLASK